MTKRICAIILSLVVIHVGGYAQSGDARLRNYISAAKAAMDNNTTSDAIAHLKNAISVAPDNFVPLYILGSVYSDINDNTNAAKYYSEALNLMNSNTISQKYYECFGTTENVSYRKIVTSIYDALSVYYKNLGKIGLARRYHNLNIQLNIASGYKAPVASSLEQIYLCYAEECKWDSCLEYFTEILTVIPHGDGWNMCESICHAAMGDCYAQLGQELEMISEYQRAAKLGHLGAMQILKNVKITY